MRNQWTQQSIQLITNQINEKNRKNEKYQKKLIF